MDKTVIIIRGLPGSGKSELAEFLVNGLENAAHCEADTFFIDEDGEYEFNPQKIKAAHAYCLSKFKGYVYEQRPLIVVSNTSTERKKEWEVYYAHAKENGYKIHVVIKENYHEGISSHGVPRHKMNQMAERFEVCLR